MVYLYLMDNTVSLVSGLPSQSSLRSCAIYVRFGKGKKKEAGFLTACRTESFDGVNSTTCSFGGFGGKGGSLSLPPPPRSAQNIK